MWSKYCADGGAMDHEGHSSLNQTGAETVYGTHEDNTMVMSEKVQSLAGSIYQEFERMIQRYDEDVVKTLMPLLVNVLECLDAAYQSNQEQDVELELLREDNEQLVTQYEREKSARKQAEQKLLETEDLAEAENKDLASRLESLESIVRMLELKHKNSLEHASRLEERESELKREYSKLHERYTELFKTHVDYMERTKLLMGSTHSQMSSTSDRLDVNRARLHPMSRSSGPVSYGFASLENSTMLDTETICSPNGSSGSDSGPLSFQNELDNIQTLEKAAETDSLQQMNQATSPQSEPSPVHPAPSSSMGRSMTKKEQRSGNTLYQELSFQDNEESEENEVTVNDNFFGMGKEVENLILENNELLATKNALNIVKDDLIVKVDELTGENEIMREDLRSAFITRQKLTMRISELEEELKKTKEQLKQQNSSEQEDEGEISMAQRKRFTRVEMARVLMERNQYKERFMELQEAVRWTEMIRASRTVESLDKKSKHKFWKFFSNLFSSSERPQPEQPGLHLRYNAADHHVAPAVTNEGRLALPPGATGHGTSRALTFTSDVPSNERAQMRKNEQYRQVRAHVQKEDGRLHAYGWSLPGSKASPGKSMKQPAITNSCTNSNFKVPVPIYCQPIAEANPHMKVFCASGVNLQGGFNRDGGCLIGASIFYSQKSTPKITEITSSADKGSGNGNGSGIGGDLESLDKQITLAMETSDPNLALSSYVWICTSTHTASTVTVIDANDASVVLDSFPVCQTHLLCICTVMGALEKDYAMLENSEVTKAGETLEKPGEGPDDLGRVEFVRVPEENVQEKSTTRDGYSENNNTTEVAQEVNAEDAAPNLDGCNAVVEKIDVPPISPMHFEKCGSKVTVINNNLDDLTFPKPVNPILGSPNPLEEPPMSSVGPTMWLGAQNGMLYVHSSVARWRDCLHKICLPDAVLAIVHVECRVVAALANGKIAIFRRALDGQWDLRSYHLVTLGCPKQSVRCLAVIGDKIWAAHRNKIYIVDPITLSIVHILEAHPRKESQVRQMAATGLGVWVSIRLDSTLRLYHAHTYEHLDDVDIEPYVSKMLGTGKLGFSFVRITALHVSCNRLWIGTGNGVIISVPLTETNGTVGSQKVNSSTGGSSISSSAGSSASSLSKTNFIPRCFMANAQLSFHGHRDSVKFFVSVPMPTPAENPIHFDKSPDMLVLSGGEGYIDFRLGDGDMENSIILEPNQTIENRGDKSYLIVWHVTQN
ncbi:JNK-interacting protein 3 isoform X3 [Phlebotomus papatasi]|uniref:JNK-interacting protein 3 isoform X3 n=1 Tax=Phlebotomus papatasi TaxID=29031 RepID=UPI0024840B86|nr:JNK-interacting protein 3 isoform X3 [Phlebotomus papatasi]